MRTYLEAKDFMNLKNVISTISAKDAVVSFIFGKKVVEDRIVNECDILAGNEQLLIQFISLKPNEFDKPVLVHFRQKELLSVMGSYITFNEKVYFEPVAGGCNIGIDDSANIKVPTIGVENLPKKIVPDKEKISLQFKASANQFAAALMTGMRFTGYGNGLENVALIFDRIEEQDEKVSATVKVYSTDSYNIGRGQAPITIVNNEKSLTNRKELCKDGLMVVPTPKNNVSFDRIEEQDEKVSATVKVCSTDSHSIGREQEPITIVNNENSLTNRKEVCKDGLMVVPTPKNNVSNLCKLLSMCKDCMVAVSDKHVSVAIGRTIYYTFVKASKVVSIFNQMENWIASPKSIRLVFDSEVLKQKVDLLNAANELYEEKKPVRFFIGKDKVRIGIDASDAAMVEITPVDSDIPQELEINFNGKLLSSVISTLKKGNLRISFLKEENLKKFPIEFVNGDLEKTTENFSVIYMMPVNDYENPASVKKEAETDDVSEE